MVLIFYFSPKTEEDRRPRYGTIIPSVTQRASPKPYTVSSHAPLSTSGTRENDAVLSAASTGNYNNTLFFSKQWIVILSF